MSDGISDNLSINKNNKEWETVTVPFIKKNLLGKEPTQLSPHENCLVYNFYNWEKDMLLKRVSKDYADITRPFWDAYLGQGKYKHSRNGKKVKLKDA